MDFAIVLTGCIKVNTNFVALTDENKRKQDYLNSIKYYTKFAPVYFIENSTYDIKNDKDFRNIDNLIIYKAKPSKFFDRGKGFQTFEMIDSFVKNQIDLPKSFLIITGRYIIENIKEIIDDCINEKDNELIIDVYKRSKLAVAYMLYVTELFYKNNLLNIYKQTDDSKGIHIEHVLYNKLIYTNYNYRMFLCAHNIMGRRGTDNNVFKRKSKWGLLWRKWSRMFIYYIKKDRYLPQ